MELGDNMNELSFPELREAYCEIQRTWKDFKEAHGGHISTEDIIKIDLLFLITQTLIDVLGQVKFK